ncbi:CubicO group peptidase (beta-lactamase class C family) [Bradyrhizobium sp. LM4.3]
MILQSGLRALLCGALVLLGAMSFARAEGTYEIPAGAHFNRDKLAKVSEFFKNEVATGKIAGATVLIQQRGKPVFREAFGVQDVASKAPITDKTIFRLFSMTKAITSVVAMQLVEDGKIKPDDPVSKYIPSFANVKVGVEKKAEDGTKSLELVPPNRPMTVHDLMTHTSGVTYGFYGDSLVRKAYRDANIYAGDFDLAEFAERIAKLPLHNQPGALWQYGHSTDILARVMEVASGKPLLEIEREKLLVPLGMVDTGFFVTDPEKQKLLAQPVPNDSDFRVGRINDPTVAKKMAVRQRRHGLHHGGLCALRADAAQRRHPRWQNHPQARDVQADGDRSDRPQIGRRSRLFLLPRRRFWLRPRTRGAHRPRQRKTAAARRSRRTEMGRRLRLLFRD